MTMTLAVAHAIDELAAQFPDSVVTATETGDGGAWVHVEPVAIGDSYDQATTWITFLITSAYPDSDVYPHFIRADLSRRDGAPLGESFSPGAYGPAGTAAVQVSRRSPETLRNNATAKLLKVLEWVRSR